MNRVILFQYNPFTIPCRVGSVVSVSASRTVDREFASSVLAGSYQRHHKNGTNCLPTVHGTHALGLEFGSAARLSKRPGSV